MRTAFITNDLTPMANGRLSPGGCAYYRCMLPMNVLRGQDAVFGPPIWTGTTGFGVKINSKEARFGFDVVVLKMMMERWVPEQMRVAKELGQILIVDVDDAYDHLHDANIAKTVTDPTNNKIANRNHYREVIAEADVVTVSTPFLLDYYSTIHPNVVMIRNGVNPDQFGVHRMTGGKPVLGWVGALRWRSNDAETAVPWLGEFLEEHDLMFHHAGHMPDTIPFAEQAGINPDRMILSPMRVLTEYHEMMDFDIGLVLLSDIPFNEAKSTIKGLEYASSGIPFVAQGLPEYRRLAELGVGRVADTPEQWKQHLTDLLDFKTRKREAAINRRLVVEEHSIQARAREWAELFSAFAGHTAPVKTGTIPFSTI